MDCETHRKPYEYVCKASSCNFMLLCGDCRRDHLKYGVLDRNVHSADIIPLKQAYEQADTNIKKNINNLKQIIQPFQNQQQIFQIIQAQKRKLNQERDQIIRKINQVFNREISDLEMRNRVKMAENKQSVPFDKIKQRIVKLEQAKKLIKMDPNQLKEALNHSEQKYIDQLRKNSVLSSMNIESNQYYVYDDIKHDFFIARLDLKRKTLNNKLLQKVYNQSNLYFLIDDYKQGKFLHYFSAGQNVLRIFDLESSMWKQIRYEKGQLPSYGATVYDYKTGRFYLIGGQVGAKKCNSIMWYSKQQGWCSSQMSKQRSSAMATILYDKSGNSYILIAGGSGDERRHLKTCQLFVPKKNICVPISSMNFAVTSGCLVTFNESIVFRIGGLGQFKPNVASICEIPEKCDFSTYLETNQFDSKLSNQSGEKQMPKWAYMDIQVVNSQVITKYNLFYANQGGIQINPNQLMIFGGMSHNNMGTQQSYIIQISAIKTKSNQTSMRYFARWINKKPMISAQGFTGLRPIIYKKKVMSLQNISFGDRDLYQREKRLVEFDMYQWKEIENVVNF